MKHYIFLFFFFFNDTATTEIYTLSLHDALPIFELFPILKDFLSRYGGMLSGGQQQQLAIGRALLTDPKDRKSTRLNSSHANISYAVFCLKKKKNKSKSNNIIVRRRNYGTKRQE